ncbi:CD209 antigen-like protein E [Anguilla rostrata]
MEPLSACLENNDGIHVQAGRDDTHRFRLLRRVAILLLCLVLAEGLLLALAVSSMFPVAAPGLEQTAGDDGKATEAMELMSQCQADLRTMSLLLLNISQDARCQLCPEKWLWSWGSCYFFSVGLEDDRKWDESMEFCEEYNASLAVIEDHREMEFIQGKMRVYQQMEFLWVGLTDSLKEGHWVWQNGNPHQKQSLLEVQWNTEHRDCADVREDGSLFAVSCDAYGAWVCEKPAEWGPSGPLLSSSWPFGAWGSSRQL